MSIGNLMLSTNAGTKRQPIRETPPVKIGWLIRSKNHSTVHIFGTMQIANEQHYHKTNDHVQNIQNSCWTMPLWLHISKRCQHTCYARYNSEIHAISIGKGNRATILYLPQVCSLLAWGWPRIVMRPPLWSSSWHVASRTFSCLFYDQPMTWQD